MNTENLSTLKIHKLTQAQYDRELEAGRIDETALYLTPEEEIDLSAYATIEQMDGKADVSHAHTVSNITDLTATATELNYMDGVTSNVQEQLDMKAPKSHTEDYNNPHHVTPAQIGAASQEDIDKLNSLCGVLPIGYSQLEYIESTGTQFIDTGLKCASGYIADVKWMCTTDTGAGQTVIGSDKIVHFGIDRSVITGYTLYSDTWGNINGFGATNQLYDMTIGMLNGNQYVICNGEMIYSGAKTGDVSSDSNISVLARNENGIYKAPAYARIYALTLRTENGAIVRDYVPCRNKNGQVGLYDLVNGVFYGNTGTGAFIGGNPTTERITPARIGLTTETWTFTLEDGSIVKKAVYVE